MQSNGRGAVRIKAVLASVIGTFIGRTVPQAGCAGLQDDISEGGAVPMHRLDRVDVSSNIET